MRFSYMPLVHFFAVASHCMPAFLQAASVFGVPANAGAVKATTRLKARIDTNAFMMGFLRLQMVCKETTHSATHGMVGATECRDRSAGRKVGNRDPLGPLAARILP